MPALGAPAPRRPRPDAPSTHAPRHAAPCPAAPRPAPRDPGSACEPTPAPAVELRLEGNPLVFPPPGILSQGAEAVLDFIRGHRHSDLFSADSERSAAQVAASREQLLQSLSEAEARADEGSPTPAEAAKAPPTREQQAADRPAPPRSAARASQRRNASFFS